MEILQLGSSQLQRIVGSVAPVAWDNITPADLTVHQVVDHVVAGNIFAVRLLAGASAAAATAGLDTDQLGDDPLAALTSTCDAQQAAFTAADPTLDLHHPSGDISLETFLRFRLGELVVHAWDIAIGADLNATLDARLVDGLWTMVEPHLNEMRTMGTFGPGASTNLAPDVSPQARLLDAFGRRA